MLNPFRLRHRDFTIRRLPIRRCGGLGGGRRVSPLVFVFFTAAAFGARNPAATAANQVPDGLPVGAFAAMADLAYVDLAELREKLNPVGESKLSTREEQAVSELKKLAVDTGLAAEDELNPIVEYRDFSRTRPPFAVVFVRDKADRPLYVLAFRGTNYAVDWLNNAGGFVGFVPSYYERADRLVKALKKHVEDRSGVLVLTGHSLGGGIAEYAAAKNGLVAVTFNSAHLSQPFEPDPRGKVYAYRITGKRWWNNTLSGDFVNLLRLGGNFEQSLLISVRVGRNFVLRPHAIDRFYEWNPGRTETYLPFDSGINADRPLSRSELLRSMPTLVAEAPALVRESVRRKDINQCEAFRNERVEDWPDVWDFRFRYGTIWDSYPAGGLPIENMRILDPSANIASPADVADTLTLETSFSHPLSTTTAWALNLRHRSLSYHRATSHDFSITKGALGALHTFESLGVTAAFAATFQRFKSIERNVGQAFGAALATTWERPLRWLTWQSLGVAALRRAGTRGGNGTVVDADMGLRRLLHQSGKSHLLVQTRAFTGHRSAKDRRFANSQWGAGFGLAGRHDWVRFFVEPALRWTRHDVLEKGVTFTDREYVFRAELACEIRKSIGDWRIMGWEITLAQTFVNNRTAAGAGSYDRRISALELSKHY
jgi:hypothetical protein